MAPWKQWTKMPVGGGTKKGRDAAFRMKRFAKGSFPTGAVAKGSFPKGAVAMSDRSRYQTVPPRNDGQSALGAAFTLVKCNWGIGMSTSTVLFHVALVIQHFWCSRSQRVRI